MRLPRALAMRVDAARERWRGRVDAWMLGRVPAADGPVEIRRNRIYIVPTRFGWGFALTALVMLLGAMNYSNSMAFALAFLMGGLGLVCMHHTHANLANLRVRAGRTPPVFAGEDAAFELIVDNPSRLPRYSLALALRHAPAAATEDVDPTGTRALTLHLPTRLRGWCPIGVVSLATEFPLGLFHAWTWMRPPAGVLVYPRPAPPGLPPPATVGSGGHIGSGQAGHDEFAGLRPYRAGDALHAIHWKSLPRTGRPMVKLFDDSAAESHWLDWDMTLAADPEQRLSQLTRWVLDAEAAGQAYGLRLPGMRIPPHHGEAHRHACLRALALFGRAGVEPGA